MKADDLAYRLFDEATDVLDIGAEPRKGLDLLWTAAKKYPNTPTVYNYVLDAIISYSTHYGLWDEANEACLLAARIKLQLGRYYRAQAKACRLSKEGRHIEAAEARLEAATESGRWYGSIRNFADEFARLGARDRAWELYNEAAVLAVQEGYSPHIVRRSMANLLMEENKPAQAVAILIEGIWEAEQLAPEGAPKSMTVSLRKALRASGLEERGLAEKIVAICKAEGKERAVQVFREEMNG